MVNNSRHSMHNCIMTINFSSSILAHCDGHLKFNYYEPMAMSFRRFGRLWEMLTEKFTIAPYVQFLDISQLLFLFFIYLCIVHFIFIMSYLKEKKKCNGFQRRKCVHVPPCFSERIRTIFVYILFFRWLHKTGSVQRPLIAASAGLHNVWSRLQCECAACGRPYTKRVLNRAFQLPFFF